jgi:hypothetical protein
VRYAASWTQPGIVEELSAAPGAAEQRLVILNRPVPAESQGENTTLDLLAALRLSPAASLFANGASKWAFTTSGG